MSIKLKTEVKQWIKEDQELQLLIAKAFYKKNIVTVQRWLQSDREILAGNIVLDIIRKYKGLKKDVELTESTQEAAA